MCIFMIIARQQNEQIKWIAYPPSWPICLLRSEARMLNGTKGRTMSERSSTSPLRTTMLLGLLLVATVLMLNIKPSDATQLPDTFGLAYAAGKFAYAGERWFECVAHMERALQLFRRHQNNVVRCRGECHRQADRQESLLLSAASHDRLDLYERTIRDTLCFIRCQKSRSKRIGKSSFETLAADRAAEIHILDQKPYDYLQLCYYKVGDLQNALSSAYTFLLHDPNHEVMKSNFRFYTSQPDVKMQNIRNLEAQPYQEHFLRGNDAYKRNDFEEAVSNFESALHHYFRAEDKCRLLCEGQFESGPTLDLTMTVANHFTFSLRCKQRCAKKLAFVYGEQYDDYLASHFHYLQFAYYQIGELAKACEAVASHLLFHPDNEVTLHNKDFYAAKINADDLFTPRRAVIHYVQQDKDEKLLLAFIETNFVTSGGGDGDDEADKQLSNKAFTNNVTKTGYLADSTFSSDVLSLPIPRNVTLVMTEHQLKGRKRFAADGLASTEECQELIQLATEAAVHGDGYGGKTSPHTQFETFEGLTIGRAAVLVSLGLLKRYRVQLLLDVSERGRAYVERHFQLTQNRMYFSYTHLVCRTAHPDSPTNRSDLSHPVHADNCLLTPDGQCIKARPAYTWRDYSAILYLNNNFEGGEFIFADVEETVQATVHPACGRLVGFSAGHENTHGVRAVRRGRRCALAMWFTMDSNHRERERFLATQVLAAESTKTSAVSVQTPNESQLFKQPTLDGIHSPTPASLGNSEPDQEANKHHLRLSGTEQEADVGVGQHSEL